MKNRTFSQERRQVLGAGLRFATLAALGPLVVACSEKSYNTLGSFPADESLAQYLQDNGAKEDTTDILDVKDMKKDPDEKNVLLNTDNQETGTPSQYLTSGVTCEVKTDDGSFVKGEVYVNHSLNLTGKVPKGEELLNVVATTRFDTGAMVLRAYNGLGQNT